MADPAQGTATESGSRSAVPSGTIAFLFTDIEGSTRLLDALGADRYADVLNDHRRILRECFARWDGSEVDTQGDSFFVAFPRASDAVQCALDAQLKLAEHDWPAGTAVKVRMAVHAGEALRQDAGYVGMEVHRGARIMAAGHGGQVLLSSAAAALVRDQLPTGAGLDDLGEHEFKDLAHPERVFQLTHPDLPSAFPPLKAAGMRSNLPTESSTFIGREDVLREVGSLVDDPEVRLVTLIGPGRTGKTRIAIRVAGDHARGFEDGVFFVDLASASETNAALALIVQTLGLSLLKEQPAIELLKHHLRSTNVLLVLDNFEQLKSAVPAVAELLEACPRLSLLVTSREPLHLRAEFLFPVQAMTLPPDDAPIGEVSVGSFEAIQLFVVRARAANPEFRMTDENAAAIVEICRRVDGLPLAIELATAWLKLFSPEALRDRLGSRLDLLRGGRVMCLSANRRSAPPSSGAGSCSSRGSNACLKSCRSFRLPNMTPFKPSYPGSMPPPALKWTLWRGWPRWSTRAWSGRFRGEPHSASGCSRPSANTRQTDCECARPSKTRRVAPTRSISRRWPPMLMPVWTRSRTCGPPGDTGWSSVTSID
jgi:class 3 adenylate cyclase